MSGWLEDVLEKLVGEVITEASRLGCFGGLRDGDGGEFCHVSATATTAGARTAEDPTAATSQGRCPEVREGDEVTGITSMGEGRRRLRPANYAGSAATSQNLSEIEEADC